MGLRVTTYFGYGVKIEDSEYEEVFDILAANYPLLDILVAGNDQNGLRWTSLEKWVFIKSTIVRASGFEAMNLSADNFVTSDEGLAELNRFMNQTHLASGKPQWTVINYQY